MNVLTTDTPITFYIGKQAKLKDSEEIVTQTHFTIPFSVYKNTEISELGNQLSLAFENSGYFETIYNFDVLNCKPPRIYKLDNRFDFAYFERFNPCDVPVPDNNGNFNQPFNITLSGGLLKRKDETEWCIGFYVNLPKLLYQNIPIKKVCDNLCNSFVMYISNELIREEIELIYEKDTKEK